MPISLPPALMVSVSGFRGRVGNPFTPELVAGLAAAFGAFLQDEGFGDTVCVGRDSRTSGPMFLCSVVAGLQSVGTRVVDLGVVPTPTLVMATEHHGSAGGIAITASHNSAEWNALKLVTGEGTFLDAELSARFQEYLRSEDPSRADWDRLGEVVADPAAWPRHLTAILGMSELDLPGIRARAFHVALDCVHGAGGLAMPELLEQLGCRVSSIGTDPDGRFPRDPEPTPANLERLGHLVRESGAEVGFAVDPDVDRLSLVDEGGQPLGEDLTLALASAVVLRRTPGPVVTNLSTSRVIDDVATAFGCKLLRTAVGEVNVARRMQAEGAVIGGEGNGGVIHPRLQYTRDALAAAALILQHLLEEGDVLSSAVSKWPSYVIVKEKVSFPLGALPDAYRTLIEGFAPAETDTSDGLRLAWLDKCAWLHVRPSGTEPVVRLIAEAPEAAEAHALVRIAAERLQGITRG